MDSTTTGQNGSRKAVSWWILVVVALIVGGLIGYYLGSAGVGTGLVPEETAENTPL